MAGGDESSASVDPGSNRNGECRSQRYVIPAVDAGRTMVKQLLHAGQSVGDFRALLWQQGESDVIEATPTDVYISRLIAIKDELERQWGHSFLWMPAKSTLHPEVYSKPLEEGWIRAAIHELWDTTGFASGPDTDILGGIGLHRAVTANSQHFTLLGQQQAGLLWCISIWNMFQRRETHVVRSGTATTSLNSPL